MHGKSRFPFFFHLSTEVSTNIETKPLKPVGEKLDGVIEEERIVADRVDTPDGATLSKSWSRWMKKTERAAGARTRTSRLHAAQECQLPFGRVPRWTTVFLAQLSAFCIPATDRKTDCSLTNRPIVLVAFCSFFSFLVSYCK